MQLYSCFFPSAFLRNTHSPSTMKSADDAEEISVQRNFNDPFASPRCSSSSMSFQQQKQKSFDAATLNRQESFKRSRAFQADDATPSTIPSSACSPMSILSSPTTSVFGYTSEAKTEECNNIPGATLGLSGLTVKDAPRGQKRSTAERLSVSTTDFNGSRKILYKTPIELQDEIASYVSSHLVVVFRGQVDPKPIFVGTKPSSIPFAKYVQRLMVFTNKYADEKDGPGSIGVRCAALAVEFIERANLNLNDCSIHRCFLAAYLLGIKLIYDFYMSNAFWGEVGGLSVREVNAMEIVFCESLKWDFKVTPEAHEQRYQQLVNRKSELVTLV